MIRIALKDVAKKKGYTLTDIAAGTGISMNTLSVLGRGESKGIQFDTLEKICRYLDATPNDLLNLAPDEYVVELADQPHHDDWVVMSATKRTVIEEAMRANRMYNATTNSHNIIVSHTGWSEEFVQFFVGLPIDSNIVVKDFKFDFESATKWLSSLDEEQQESISRQCAAIYMRKFFGGAYPERIFVAFNTDGTGGRIYPFWVGKKSGKLVRLTFQSPHPKRPKDLE